MKTNLPLNEFFLIKPGELMLKGNNRPMFLKTLRRNMRAMMKDIPHILDDRHHRIYLYTSPENAEETTARLRRFIGI